MKLFLWCIHVAVTGTVIGLAAAVWANPDAPVLWHGPLTGLSIGLCVTLVVHSFWALGVRP